MDSTTIRVLYENVLNDDVQANRIKDNGIRKAINNMKEVYKPDPTSLQSDVVEVADYNDLVHRCAYLHKYAPLHTALVSEMLMLAMQKNAHIFQAIINKHGCFNVCSLGGGPGSDVIGVLDVLHSVLGFFQVNATIVDIMVGWKYTFESILAELQDGDYGHLSEHVSEQYLNWSYEEANLLSRMTNESNKAIASANLITMVKFVSASSCKDTPAMIGKIFRSMKQGALVLYIDNAGGGFHQLVTEEAAACNLVSVFGPLKHYLYSNVVFNVKRFGYTPCLETTVTVHLLKKPIPTECNDLYYYNSSYLVSHTDTGAVPKQSSNPQRRSRSQSRSRQNKRVQSGLRGQSNGRSNNGNLTRSQSQPRVSTGLSMAANNPRKSLVDVKEAQALGVVNKATNGSSQPRLADSQGYSLVANSVNNSGQSLLDIKRAQALSGYYQATNSAVESWLAVLQSNAQERNNPGTNNVSNPRIVQVDNKQAEALDVIQKATNRAVQSWLTDCRGNSLVANNPNIPRNTAQSGTKKAGTTTVNKPLTQPALQKKPSLSTNESHISRKTLLDNRQAGTVNKPSQVANDDKGLTKYQSGTKQPGAVNKYSSVTSNTNALRKAQLDSKVPLVTNNANALRKTQMESKVPVTNNANALRKTQMDSKIMPAAQSRPSTSTPVDNCSYIQGNYSTFASTNYPIYSQPTAQRNSVYNIGTANTAPTLSYQQQPAAPRSAVTYDDSRSDNNCCCCVIS